MKKGIYNKYNCHNVTEYVILGHWDLHKKNNNFMLKNTTLQSLSEAGK